MSYVGVNATCSLDPCTGDICEANLACEPSSSGSLTGTCQTAVTDLGCVPGSTPRCFEGTFCQLRGTQTEVDAGTVCGLKISAQGTSPGTCVTPAREGAHCDGEWNQVMAGSSSLICSPCEPGMACVGTICHRKCTSDQECPCSSLAMGFACRAALPGSGTRVCDICRADGANCQGEGRPNYACCMTGTACTAFGATFVCCRGSTSSCDIAVSNQCCSGLTCQSGACATCRALGTTPADVRECCGVDRRIINNVCAACRTGGQTAGSAAECCTGLTFDGTQCKVGCTIPLGRPCEVPGAQAGSQCAIGLVTDCDATTGAPTCTAMPGATAEVCDGIDNDCDGMRDEGFEGATCTDVTVFETLSGHAASCPSSPNPISGHVRCTRAGRRCVALRDYDFCNVCGAGGSGPQDPYGRYTMNCGGCSGNSCSMSNLCSPNGHCASFGGSSTCQSSGCNQWACWTSSDVGTESCAP